MRAVEVVEWPVARRPASPRPGPGPRRPRPTQHHLAEAVEVELADEAGEVGGFEELGLGPGRPDAAAAAPAAAPGSPRAPGTRAGRAEQLGLEERLVDEQPLASAVPADGAVPRAVHQPPQLGGEVVGVDGGGQQRLLHRPPGPWASPRRAWLSHRSRSPGPSLRPAPSCQRPAAEARTVGARVPARPPVWPMGPRVPAAWWPTGREPALPLGWDARLRGQQRGHCDTRLPSRAFQNRPLSVCSQEGSTPGNHGSRGESGRPVRQTLRGSSRTGRPAEVSERRVHSGDTQLMVPENRGTHSSLP